MSISLTNNNGYAYDSFITVKKQIILMKKLINIILISLFLCSFVLLSCSKNDSDLPTDTVGNTIAPVTELKALATKEENEILLRWNNPKDESLLKIEITYSSKNVSAKAAANPMLVDVNSGEGGESTLVVPGPGNYVITVVAINKAGAKSEAVSVEGTAGVESGIPLALRRADTLMTALTQLYLDGKPRDIWSANYPQSDGYWDGAAVIWGHGAAFSGYAALKEAAEEFPEYKTKYASDYDNRLLTAIDMFRNTRDGGAEAYAVYPGEGDERYFDDNVWVGIDMVDLYMLTHDTKYLDRAKLVWNFILTGTDDLMGGGVYWKEGSKSKHTCSTAPSAVMAAKLYLATHEEAYLTSAKELYAWCKKMLQDPADFLYWDNVRLSDESNPDSNIETAKDKYAYNSGQPMQAAALLYTITQESKYLTDAQLIAEAAYKKWFIPFNSYILGESFQILEQGHVWFQAIMFRGFVELYKIDRNRTYVTAYEKTLANAWLSNCRNRETNLLNSDFRGGTSQSSWEILHEGACVEMLARLASLALEEVQ